MDWEKRSVKRKVRELLLQKVKDWFIVCPQKRISFLGFPAAQAIFERKLIKEDLVYQLRLYERDSDVFSSFVKPFQNEVLNSYPNVDCFAVRKNFDEDVLGLNENSFLDTDFIWLDYCGPITQRKLFVIEKILKSSFSDEGVLALTFMIGREQFDFNKYNLRKISNINLKEVPKIYLSRIYFLVNFLEFLSLKVNVEFYPYKDNAPMLLVVIKRRDSYSKVTLESSQYQIYTTFKDSLFQRSRRVRKESMQLSRVA